MIFQRLQETNEKMEIWWDSLPDTRSYWKNRILQELGASGRKGFAEELDFFGRLGSPGTGGTQGATTNPRLFQESIEIHLDKRRRDLLGIGANKGPRWSTELYGTMRAEVFRENAATLLPLWEESEGRYGWICAQLAPLEDITTEEQVKEAIALASIAPNIMIKVPGSARGYEVIRRLTALGIATNSTLSFSVSQFEAYAAALESGLKKARARGTRAARPWRSVFTFMAGRFGREPILKEQAARANIDLDDEGARWAEILVLKRVLRLCEERALPCKILVCSLKVDSWNGRTGCFHLTKNAGEDCVFSISPPFLRDLLLNAGDDLAFEESRADGKVPPDIAERLLRVPYVRRAHESGGIAPEDFSSHPVFVQGFKDAREGYEKTIAFIEATLGGERP